MSTQPPTRTADFVASLGVNVHVEYTDGKYANTTNVIADLAYLGIDHVRDQTLNSHNQGQASYAKLADAGIKFDFFVEGNLSSATPLLDSFAQAHPGSITAIEGPNEVNNFPISYDALTGGAAAIAFQDALYAAVKSDALLASTPVYNFTDNVALGGGADYGNIHPYPSHGEEPIANLISALNGFASAEPGMSTVITEAGYSTLKNAPDGVSNIVQAKETLNLLMDAAKLGVPQTYLYELLDAYPDPTKSNVVKHFGLFDINNAPKPVAIAIHNLTTILGDTSADASSFTPDALNFTVFGMPSTASSFEMEKSSGAHDIVLWNEPTIWDSTQHVAVAAAGTAITVDLGAVYSDVTIYDPLKGSDPIKVLHNVEHFKLSISDHPVIIEVGPTEIAAKHAAESHNVPAAIELSSALLDRFDFGNRHLFRSDQGALAQTDGAHNNDAMASLMATNHDASTVASHSVAYFHEHWDAAVVHTDGHLALM